MFTQLPAEIIFLIVESVDLIQRARVMLTCRYLHQVLEPFLYRHLELLDPESHHRSHRLHQTLHDRPALISQIVTYHGPLCPTEGKGTYYNPFLPWELWESDDVRKSRALSIFKRAVNIRDLYFTDFIDWIAEYAWRPLREAVDDLVLDRLALRTRNDNVEIVHLLRNQPELTQLEILWGGGLWENLKETDIPKLKSVSASLETAAVIVPGRPVSAIKLPPSQGADRLEEGLLQCLNMSTRPIRQFEMRLCRVYKEDLVRDQLQALARNMPTIEDLTIHVGGRISGRMLLLEIPAFGSISSLTLLEASLVHTPFSTILDEDYPTANSLLPSNLDTPDSWADLESQLKKMCPNLTSLYHTTLTYLGLKR
ncbi:hypothetical protein FS837_005593 [Tulasnella sp. UAMH 9824]|nr:hypothetical protein FS837_005593 [Tulasnella sp. UAMH 9824]